MSVALQGLTAARLCALVPEVNLSEARKVLSAVHRRGEPLESLTSGSLEGVRARALTALRGRVHLPELRLVAKNTSAVDPFAKFVFALDEEGKLNIETVRIPLEREGRFTVCVSSQVGCAQGCTYCATGRLGLLRNLESWQIVEQVRTVHLDLRSSGAVGRVHGIVFQGMGEPMANFDAVLEAMSVLCEPSASQVSASNITVSTVGSNPAAIRRLAREFPKARLALSIGAARPEVRATIMPVEKIHPLRGAVMDAAVEHAVATGLQPLWAVTPLRGVNDSPADAAALAELFHSFTARTGGIRPRLSVVPYNAIGEWEDAEDPFQRTPAEEEALFRNELRAANVFSHRRYSGGGDVGAACGQLAGAAAKGGEAAGGDGAAVTNWAGSWAPGVRDDNRPTLADAYL